MQSSERALFDIPVALVKEITRFGGLNPFGKPLWRVVLAENVLEQRFGQMRHMPQLCADDVEPVLEVEPEAWSAGEMWLPKYDGHGYCLERWFPANVWGSQVDWENITSQDEVTRLLGEFPRHGEYQMVNDSFEKELHGADFWKTEILKWMRQMDAMTGNEAARLSRHLYLARVREERRAEQYAEDVNRIHRGIVDPMLATIGATAQRVRDGLMSDMGMNSHLSAG